MKRIKTSGLFLILISGMITWSCNIINGDKMDSDAVKTTVAEKYTCPMDPEIISDKPGRCPICGMYLEKVVDSTAGRNENIVYETGYTCPMHPQIHSDTAGACPICGMPLEKVKSPQEARSVSLNTLLQPANQQVVASVPMVHMMERSEDLEMQSYGFITYDTRSVGGISSNVEGRIEKLYVKYRYQLISKGQKIMDIYSPQLMTAQENLLFILKNDPSNTSLISAAKQKLLLLGMSSTQLEKVISTGKAAYTVSVFSNYSGHIHESSGNQAMQGDLPEGSMRDISLTTKELTVKEGVYVQKGQSIFSVYNAGRAWAVINIFAGQAALVKTGDKVLITPGTDPGKKFQAVINYIEPFFREGSKTVTVRVYFDNSMMNIPIGSQVDATIFAGDRKANWLPEEAILSLGLDNVVFVRKGEAFVARKIETGIVYKHLIQVLSGLDRSEAVAANAQYLVDSESFIKTNQ
jgi:Cu(I)/Ag(I) efflux system membrane fusion protein